MKTTRHILVGGRVQGVGFRESMRKAAREFGCTGWVRNCSDGRVEAVVQGAPESVAALLAWARRGPPMARVDALEDREPAATTENFERFAVLPSA